MPDVQITLRNTTVIHDMKLSHSAGTDDTNATNGENMVTQRRVWCLRVAMGLVIATFAGVLSIASTASPVDAAGPDQIVVRASGATGEEEMLLTVNGVETARWRVAKGTNAYRHGVPAPLEITSVEVALINDNGPRDLTVEHINLGGVVLKSTAPGTTSSGTYVRSDGGCRTRASVSPVLHCNGSFTYAVPSGTVLGRPVAAGPIVNVRAIGRSGAEQMQVRINGKVVTSATVGAKWQVISATLDENTVVETAEVQFTNDASGRDLRVDYLEIDGRRFESESPQTQALGTHVAGSCAERASSSEWLHCSGWFRYRVGDAVANAAPPAPTAVATRDAANAAHDEPAPVAKKQEPAAAAPGAVTPVTAVAPVPKPTPPATNAPTTTTAAPKVEGDLINIRAMGRSGSEIMQLRVDGRVVDSWTVTSGWKLYTAGVPDADSVNRVEVQFVNDARGRDLRVDYIELDGERYQSESSKTRSSGSYSRGGCSERNSTSEWLHCSGWFRYAVTDAPVAAAPAAQSAPPASKATRTVATPSAAQPAPPSGSANGRYSIAQVIDGTIGAGDGSNPNEEAPMGRHEAPLYLPQGWNWAQGPTRNSVWGQLGSGGSRYAEFRCAVIPENGHRPSVPFRINVRNGAYYQYVKNSWQKGFDVDLTGGNHGGYLGQAGRVNNDPFSSGGHGRIEWRRESDGSFSAPWNANALMMHFWAGQRKAPASGQTAEFLTSEVRLQQPDGRNVDLSKVKVLFQCGIDYYNTTGGQGTRVPGPGIAKYNRVTTQWRPGLWVTLPGNAPANSVSDFRTWLQRNTPPQVGS